jgi:hypothetical protein
MNKGDSVICVDNKPNGSSYIMMDVPLTIGKSYIVQTQIKSETIRILDDESIFRDYRKDRFVTESEWLQRQRHNKLNELGI